MRVCSVEGCERIHCARGWCKIHYYRWRRHGDVSVVNRPGFSASPRAVCRFAGCQQVSKRGGRGWCGKHYTRWFRHGDPSVDGNKHRRREDVMDRIRSRVFVTEVGCWEWQGVMMPNGYGQIGIRNGHEYVHRSAWAYVNGPIPQGFHVHHECENRACCNPEHLRLLSAADHVRLHRQEVAA